ncbi:DUF4286 family protein [Pseudochryseolinea flava]|uniref:DUF4286 domain-containing protein n=1 Tax=Pseudochryseolinea flava TaxID=2059302 RepID=A0A364YAI1_9BACT|nr:DUF4286 family protein [Pseudochryseolinea flava]RAW03329.1 DUF4286 domain-containing protein [Pseudochryseolinea flava]
MLLYNVTIGIDKSVEQEWLAWMRESYIPGALSSKMLQDCKIFKVLHDEDEPTVSYSVQFFSESIQMVNLYLEKIEPILSEALKQRYKDKHVAFRTLLEQV